MTPANPPTTTAPTFAFVPTPTSASPTQLVAIAKENDLAGSEQNMDQFNANQAIFYANRYATWKTSMDNHPELASQIGAMPLPPLKGYVIAGPDGWPQNQWGGPSGKETVVPVPVYTPPAPNTVITVNQSNDEMPAPAGDTMPEGWSFVDSKGITWYRRYQPTPFGTENLYMTQGLYLMATGKIPANGG